MGAMESLAQQQGAGRKPVAALADPQLAFTSLRAGNLRAGNRRRHSDHRWPGPANPADHVLSHDDAATGRIRAADQTAHRGMDDQRTAQPASQVDSHGSAHQHGDQQDSRDGKRLRSAPGNLPGRNRCALQKRGDAGRSPGPSSVRGLSRQCASV
ncbi:hypothetical protein D3C81_1681070 [compost metagenome]